jgi:hypothetical protein
MALLVIIALLLFIFLIFLATEFFNIVFLGAAPFIMTKKKIVDLISREISLLPGEKVYEVGAGFARFLQAVEKVYPKAEFVGIEYSWPTYLIAKLLLKYKHSRIKLIRQNVFKTNLSDANLIYCYLTPGMMSNLGEKFSKECRPGTRIISYAFSIPNFEIKRTIREKGDTIYFYEI